MGTCIWKDLGLGEERERQNLENEVIRDRGAVGYITRPRIGPGWGRLAAAGCGVAEWTGVVPRNGWGPALVWLGARPNACKSRVKSGWPWPCGG